MGKSSEFLDLVFKKRISGDIARRICRIQDHQGRTVIVRGDIYDGQLFLYRKRLICCIEENPRKMSSNFVGQRKHLYIQ